MDRAGLKRMMQFGREAPVRCAVGIGKDPRSATLLLDKTIAARTLERDLKADPEMKTVRFGTARVEEAQDPKLGIFELNKLAPGLAKRLVRALKGTGITKVRLISEDGETEEAQEEEDEAEAAPDTREAAPPPPPPPLPPPLPPVPSAAAPDPAALQATVVGLLRRVQAEGEGPNRATLVKLAAEAGTRLKAGDLAATARIVAALQGALGGAPAPAAPASPPLASPPLASPAAFSPVKLGKAALLWRGMWAKADREMKALQDAVIAAMDEDEELDADNVAEIEANLRILDGITTRLNLSLADELDDLINAEADARPARMAALERNMAQFGQFLATDEWLDLLDDNEFHPVTVKADLHAALEAIKAALHA